MRQKIKQMTIILLAAVVLACFSAVETATAQDDIDWNNKPWLDPRVIQCVREYLDKVLIPINKERRDNNQDPYWRLDDWGRTVNEKSTPHPMGVTGSKWDNPSHFVWGEYDKPRYRNFPLGGVQRYVKEECIPRGGGGPGADTPPPPPTPSPQTEDDKCCEVYASLAVCQQRLNIELNCGYKDPPARWHLNRKVHYDWCVAVAERFADGETRIRKERLAECFAERSQQRDRGDRRAPEDVTGIWDFYLRVVKKNKAGAVINSKVVFVTTIAINQTAGGDFNGSGSGVDIDGKPLRISIAGDYNLSTTVIRGIISTYYSRDKNGERKDEFSTILTSNDTGYIPLKFVSGNKGSEGEVRMVKQ